MFNLGLNSVKVATGVYCSVAATTATTPSTVPVDFNRWQRAPICLNGYNQGVLENAVWLNHPELVGIVCSFLGLTDDRVSR